MNIKTFLSLFLTLSLFSDVHSTQNFLAEMKPKKLSKGQLKQKVAEQYEIFLRQTAKIIELNALIQQTTFDHISKLISEDNSSIFKACSVTEVNNYYENLKKITEANDKEINRLISSLSGLKSNFNLQKSNINPK